MAGVTVLLPYLYDTLICRWIDHKLVYKLLTRDALYGGFEPTLLTYILMLELPINERFYEVVELLCNVLTVKDWLVRRELSKVEIIILRRYVKQPIQVLRI